MSRLLTTTQTHLWDSVQDAVLGQNITATRLITDGKKWSGLKEEVPIKVSKNTTATNFVGMQALANGTVDTRQKMEFEANFKSMAVSLPFTELSLNATTERVINLMAVEVESATQDLADELGTDVTGAGTGAPGTGFAGFAYTIDDGTVSTTYGGLLRATYPMINSYVSAVGGGIISTDRIAVAFDTAQSGSDRPTLIPCAIPVASLYEKLLTPQDRQNKTVTFSKDKRNGSYGYNTADFRGVPVVGDEKITSGEMIFLNEERYKWYGLKVSEAKEIGLKSSIIESNDYEKATIGSDLGLSWGDWVRGANVAGMTSFLYAAGNPISANPKRNARLTGISQT